VVVERLGVRKRHAMPTRRGPNYRTAFRLRRSVAMLSQAELATEIGVSRQTINAIERGRWSPSLRLAIALAKRLDTTVEELFADPPRL
jgi:putative transcriptional regulator